ncbi:unnamed protein product [Brassica rapa subsp. trilocularis]|uniref:(rape) hypothetical protein n=1 Tax=Brassica napus TaxID=3708 RepID=A0A078IV10_BRANA|nr:unnamed protein product [Brassica napus]CDY52843.1 BnaA10g28480D [Brassica napus]
METASEAGMSNTVMCVLTDPEGTHLGSSMDIPQTAGPLQLTQLVNKFLNNQQQAVFRIRPVNRCSQTIAGHAEAVLCVSFSPDGKQLASVSGDTTVRLWDLNTETPLFTCKGHKNWVLSIAWSPDGKHLVSGSKSGELCCWNPKKGELDGNPLTGRKKWITGISWEPVHLSSPCRRFVTSSKDGDARIWDVTLKKSLICLSGHTLAVTCVKWGGDGIIYTGCQMHSFNAYYR